MCFFGHVVAGQSKSKLLKNQNISLNVVKYNPFVNSVLVFSSDQVVTECAWTMSKSWLMSTYQRGDLHSLQCNYLVNTE